MDHPNRMLSPSRTQIDDLPSCLIIDILSRLPIKSLGISRLVCKSWPLLFSDPLFVQLLRARSPTYLFHRKSGEERKFYCTPLVQNVPGENLEFESNVTSPDLAFVTSSNGLVCLQNWNPSYEIYVCNPILGESVTIPIGNTNSLTWSFLGFCSSSNRFKVLRIKGARGTAPYMAEIYAIGNGTRRWKCIGIAPTCPYMYCFNEAVNTFLNGSTHWVNRTSHNITYFNFESEQFGSLPLPPARRSDGRLSQLELAVVRVGVVDGRLCVYAGVERGRRIGLWMMKEYGVDESWTMLSSLYNPELYHRYPRELALLSCVHYRLILHFYPDAIYNPSFISLQDVARGEQLTVMSRTRTMSKTVSATAKRPSDLRSRFFDIVFKCFLP